MNRYMLLAKLKNKEKTQYKEKDAIELKLEDIDGELINVLVINDLMLKIEDLKINSFLLIKDAYITTEKKYVYEKEVIETFIIVKEIEFIGDLLNTKNDNYDDEMNLNEVKI